jgi:hypothetical protein
MAGFNMLLPGHLIENERNSEKGWRRLNDVWANGTERMVPGGSPVSPQCCATVCPLSAVPQCVSSVLCHSVSPQCCVTVCLLSAVPQCVPSVLCHSVSPQCGATVCLLSAVPQCVSSVWCQSFPLGFAFSLCSCLGILNSKLLTQSGLLHVIK